MITADAIIKVFKERFEPVQKIEQSDKEMTTQEIYDYVIALSQDKAFKVHEIPSLMERNGYRYTFGKTGFVWIMKEKR